MILKLLLLPLRLLVTTSYFLLCLFVLYTTMNFMQAAPGLRPHSFNNVKRLAKHVHAIKTPSGARYCSSVNIKYKGKPYTLTNAHCCERDPGFGGMDIRIGDNIEQIIYMSEFADVCVVTSKDTSTTLVMAKKELELFDSVLLLGYPRGEDLTPRFGYVLALNELTTVNYGNGLYLTRESHITSLLSFPGNSGSPIFNSKGEVVSLLYAGPHPLYQYSISVPLKDIKEALEVAKKLGY